VGAAAVLVYGRPNVEPRGHDIRGSGVALLHDEHDAPLLRRTALEPPDRSAGEPGRAEAHARLGHHLRRDGRGPGPEPCGRLRLEFCVQRRRLWYCAMQPTRQQAWETLTRYTTNEALLRHAQAVEASVGFYARLYGDDEDFWRATALLHDFDYEIHPTLDKHPQDGAPILREEGYPESLIEAVLSHAEHLAMPRDTE